MSIAVSDQVRVFGLSLLLGCGIGLLYDVFRILRVMIPHGRAALFAEDVLFSVLSALITFLFLIAENDGQVRLILFIGEGLGFILYFFTAGAMLLGLLRGIAARIRRLFAPIARRAGEKAARRRAAAAERKRMRKEKRGKTEENGAEGCGDSA